MSTPSEEDLIDAIEAAAERAISALFREHPEHFYYCSLLTSGEATPPFLSAWSEEALDRESAKEPEMPHWAVRRGAKWWASARLATKDVRREALRWSWADSPYCGYGEEYFGDVQRLFAERPPMECCSPVTQWPFNQWIEEGNLRLGCMESAMKRLDDKGLFGEGERRRSIVINVEFMDSDYTNTYRALRLNPRGALTEWLAVAAIPLPESRYPEASAGEAEAVGQEVQIPCDRCRHGSVVRVGQTVVDGQLRWYRSFSCQHCGNAEEDGVGFPPAELRDLLLESGGRWKLVVGEAKRVAAIKVLRSVLGLATEESAAATLRRFSAFPVVHVGTRTEAKWLKAHMDAAQVASQVVAER
jgi:hypothetical protein